MVYININFSYVYFDFVDRIDKNQIKIIFELGSRDLVDAIKLLNCFNNNCKVYAFECNPDALATCYATLEGLTEDKKSRLFFIDNAVSILDGDVTFYPFDLNKYNNIGASSMFKIDFSTRSVNDPDYNLPNPQKEVKVLGTRLDTFIDRHHIENIDLMCIDLQGYELNALKSLGSKLNNVKYIITECSISTTYINGVEFKELSDYLALYNFKYIRSNKYGSKYPDVTKKYYAEFDSLFINESLLL